MSISKETLTLAKKYVQEKVNEVQPSAINKAVKDYLIENPISGMTEDEKQQLNTKLSADDVATVDQTKEYIGIK